MRRWKMLFTDGESEGRGAGGDVGGGPSAASGHLMQGSTRIHVRRPWHERKRRHTAKPTAAGPRPAAVQMQGYPTRRERLVCSAAIGFAAKCISLTDRRPRSRLAYIL